MLGVREAHVEVAFVNHINCFDLSLRFFGPSLLVRQISGTSQCQRPSSLSVIHVFACFTPPLFFLMESLAVCKSDAAWLVVQGNLSVLLGHVYPLLLD